MKSLEPKSISILFVIVLVGCALRVYHLSTKELWLDEVNTLRTATGHGPVPQDFPFPSVDQKEIQLDSGSTFRGVIKSATSTFHPPFYFLLLNVWMKFFGDSKIGSRSLSVVFGMISIILVFIIGKQLLNAQIGLIRSAIFALSTTQIHYAQEARMYPLVMLLALVSTSLLVRIIQTRSQAFEKGLSEIFAQAFFQKACNNALIWAGYIVTNILAVYTHYYVIFLLLVHGATVVPKYKSCRNIVNRWLLALLIIVVLFLPYIPHASSVANEVNTGHWTSAEKPWVQDRMKFAPLWPLSVVPDSFIHFSLDVVRIFDDPVLDGRMLIIFGVIGVCIFTFLSACGVWALRQGKDTLIFLAFWFLIPMLATIAVDVIMDARASIVTEARYYLYSSPAYYLLLANGLVSLKNQRWRVIFVAILLGVNTVFLLRHYNGIIS